MNKKQKIIIGLTSVLCGSPIIFFILKNNHQEKNEQKNKLFIKKKEKEENKDHQKSFSFLFWIIFIILLFLVLAIILYIIYRWQKSEEIPGTGKFDKQSKKTFKSKTSSPKKPTITGQPQIQFLEEKKSLTGGVYINERGIYIVFNKDHSQQNPSVIEDILKADIDDLRSLLKASDKAFFDNLSTALKKIIKACVEFLNTYLNGQLLIDVYHQETKIKKAKNYATLKKMAKMANSFVINSHQDSIIVDPAVLIFSELAKEPGQQITDKNTKYITENNPINLLKNIMNSKQLTFIEDEHKEKHFLFFRTFKLYKFIFNLYYHGLYPFMSMNSKHSKQYSKPLKTIISSAQNLLNCIL